MVAYEMTKDDAEALHRFLMRHPAQRATRWKVYRGGLFLGAVPLLMLAAMLVSGHAPASSYLLVIPPFLAYLAFWTWLFSARMYPSRPRSISQMSLGPRTMTLGEAGVHHTWPGGEVLHFWQTIGSLEDDGACLFLRLVPDGAYLVPKRAFSSPAEVERFQAEVARRRGVEMPGGGGAVEQQDAADEPG